MTRLALVMIARNEARAIGRALASSRGHVDRMIVLDTGSSDDTVAIAEAAGAQVHAFTWCDDFAAARNAALEHSDADWNLILDADEWLTSDLSALGPDTLGANARFLGMVQVESTTIQSGALALSRTWIPRVLPKGVRYAGRIHEQPVSDLPEVRLALRIGHDGYLPEQLAGKAGRNEALLLAEIEASPEDGYLWFQLGREYDVAGKSAQAAVCLAEALRLTPASAAYRHALVVRALMAFRSAGKLGEAMALADAEIGNWRRSPDFHFVLGDLYLEVAAQDPDRAIAEHLPIVEYAWTQCLEIGERPDLDGSIAGRGGHMAAHNLAVFYRTLGDPTRATEFEARAAQLRMALT
ncbi:hypothetical protein BH11PSE2_BH11PSE2_11840 [soil metagenome]